MSWQAGMTRPSSPPYSTPLTHPPSFLILTVLYCISLITYFTVHPDKKAGGHTFYGPSPSPKEPVYATYIVCSTTLFIMDFIESFLTCQDLRNDMI